MTETIGELASRIEPFARRVVAYCGKQVADDLTNGYKSFVEEFYGSYTPKQYHRNGGLRSTSRRYYSNKGLRCYAGVEIDDFGMGAYEDTPNDVVLSITIWNAMHGFLGPISGPAAYYETVNLRDQILAEAQAYVDIGVAAAGGI